MRNVSSTHEPSDLGELERTVLELVWQCHEVTAEQLREQIDRTLKDSTVRTVLRRLEEKGYISHTINQRTFVYRPVQSRQTVAGRAAQRIVDWFCAGSVEDLLIGMVNEKLLDGDELQQLAQRIAAARKGSET